MRRLGTTLLALGLTWVGWIAASLLLQVWPFAGGGQEEELALGPATIVAVFLVVWMWAIPGALAIAAGLILRGPSPDRAEPAGRIERRTGIG